MSLKQQETLFKAHLLLLGLDEVDLTARDRSPEVNNAIIILCYLMLVGINECISKKVGLWNT